MSVLTLLLSLLLGRPAPRDVGFNQHWLEHRWATRGDGVAPFAAQLSRMSAWISVRATPTPDRPMCFDEPESIARRVLRRAPPFSIVYPTEQYFYFKARVQGRPISGNLRFTDSDDGVLHIGYFREDVDPREPCPENMQAASFDAADGIIVHRAGDLVLVASTGLVRLFWLDPAPTQRPSQLRLSESEHFVTGVLDESGFAFALLYNATLQNFFYVINPDFPLPEALHPSVSDESATLLGTPSGFVFCPDASSNRLILVGVRQDSIKRNNYFDGPFDQVPPHLDLRPMLELAYPYVREGRGIDPHGVFLDHPGQRVAISAYQEYVLLDPFLAWIDATSTRALTPQHRTLLLTYEAKRHFHRVLSAMRARHAGPPTPGSDGETASVPVVGPLDSR